MARGFKVKRKQSGRNVIVLIIITLAFIALFRFGAWIPLPMIDAKSLVSQVNLFGFLDVFSGGALSRFSILALGVSPYITASIVVQLLQMDVIPRLKEWGEEGPEGKAKLNNLTKYLALGLAFVQALLLTLGIKVTYADALFPASVVPTAFTYVYLALVATAGTAFSMWLAEKITRYGVGNGTSMLIVTGILAAFPTMVLDLSNKYLRGAKVNAGSIITFIAVLLILILIIIAVVFLEGAARKIPIQYANRPSAAKFRGKSDSNIPIKLNSASVIPVIFASTLMSLPTTIVQIANAGHKTWGNVLNMIFDNTKPVGFAVYVLLIFIFSFMYTFMQQNPEKMAENLQKNNAFIPGVRPGEDTANFISRVLFKITLLGATYLTLIATIPIIMTWIFKLPPSVQIGGTGLIIVVGVAIETAKQIKTITQEKQYDSKGFIAG